MAEEQSPAEAPVAAETEARKTAENARIARVVEDEAARKAERNRRYAGRKASLGRSGARSPITPERPQCGGISADGQQNDLTSILAA